MELELTPDEEFFAATTRRFLDERATTTDIRAMRDDPVGFVADDWKQGAELGWTSLLVSESDGGGTISGRALGDLTLVADEFGRHAAPGPLVPASVVAGALSRWGTDEQKESVLGGLLSGDVIGAWCHGAPVGPHRLGDVALEAVPGDGGFRLSGVTAPIEAGAQADWLLVTARSGDGLTQLLVPGDAPGMTRRPMKGLDLTRRFATIAFDNAEIAATSVVGEAGAAGDAVDWQYRVAIAVQLAEMVGAMHRALDMTIEWSFDRFSFGRPLASY
jgi:alkylation response protein AidB-like acyl-CoA dehydrogenase